MGETELESLPPSPTLGTLPRLLVRQRCNSHIWGISQLSNAFAFSLSLWIHFKNNQKNVFLRASKVAQWVKLLAAKPNDLRSMDPLGGKKKTTPESCPSTSNLSCNNVCDCHVLLCCVWLKDCSQSLMKRESLFYCLIKCCVTMVCSLSTVF